MNVNTAPPPQYQAVSSRTTALHTACEHLLAEQTQLSAAAQALSQSLTFFTQADVIYEKLSSPAFSVSSQGFLPLLSTIDKSIVFMSNNSKFKESATYLAKYMLCLSRALSMVESYVCRSLVNVTKSVTAKTQETSIDTDSASVLYYSKFTTNAPRINSLIIELE